MKREQPEAGEISCPLCGDVKIISGGCSAMKCMRNHESRGGDWYYWCAHCFDELPGGAHCNKCPMDFNEDTIRQVRKRDANATRRAPVDADDFDGRRRGYL